MTPDIPTSPQPKDLGPPLHVISLSCDARTPAEILEALEDGSIEDIGQGLEWGVDASMSLALSRGRPCALLVPQTGQVVFYVRPQDITLH